MIIILKPSATKEDADEILNQIEVLGLKPLYMPGSERTVLGALGDERVLRGLHLESHPLVERITPILTPYKLVSRDAHPADTIVKIDGVAVGGKQFTVIAGPRAVESSEQMLQTADAARGRANPADGTSRKGYEEMRRYCGATARCVIRGDLSPSSGIRRDRRAC